MPKNEQKEVDQSKKLRLFKRILLLSGEHWHFLKLGCVRKFHKYLSLELEADF